MKWPKYTSTHRDNHTATSRAMARRMACDTPSCTAWHHAHLNKLSGNKSSILYMLKTCAIHYQLSMLSDTNYQKAPISDPFHAGRAHFVGLASCGQQKNQGLFGVA